jgi:hypothetical protein
VVGALGTVGEDTSEGASMSEKNPGVRDTPTMKIAEIDTANREKIRRDLGDIAGLADLIKERGKGVKGQGMIQPVAISQDKCLIKGLRRIKAAEILGWDEVPYHVVHGVDGLLEHLTAYREADQGRKEMTLSERLAFAEDIRRLEEAEAKDRQREGGRAGGEGSGKLPEASTGDTRDKVGKAIRMSGKSCEHGLAVLAAAKAEPEKYGKLVEQMDKDGKVNPAYRKLVGMRNAEKYKGLADQHATDHPNEHFNIHQGKMEDLLCNLLDNDSVGLFLTDPPWMKPQLYGELARLAKDKLRPGGLCAAYVGNLCAAAAIVEMSKHLEWWGMITIRLGGRGDYSPDRNVKLAALSVVVFGKPPLGMAPEFCINLIHGAGPEKELYEWGQGQPEAEVLVTTLSYPGELVVDPFCGSGTIPAAAKATKRRWVATELDPERVKLARWRVHGEREMDPSEWPRPWSAPAKPQRLADSFTLRLGLHKARHMWSLLTHEERRRVLDETAAASDPLVVGLRRRLEPRVNEPVETRWEMEARERRERLEAEARLPPPTRVERELMQARERGDANEVARLRLRPRERGAE